MLSVWPATKERVVCQFPFSSVIHQTVAVHACGIRRGINNLTAPYWTLTYFIKLPPTPGQFSMSEDKLFWGDSLSIYFLLHANTRYSIYYLRYEKICWVAKTRDAFLSHGPIIYVMSKLVMIFIINVCNHFSSKNSTCNITDYIY